MEKNIKTITLVLTESCNLGCIYCYENFKSEKKMNIEIAYKILDDELMNANLYDCIYIDFFGGEPFLCFDEIKQIVLYVKRKNISNIHFVTSTNGTLIHNEVATWLENNKDILDVGLSIDGTKRMHNVNRSNSFENIDLDFFKNNYGYHPVKMTISPKTLCYLYEGVVFLHKKGFKVNCNLAFGMDWSKDEYKDILIKELNKLIQFYIENDNYEPCSMLGAEIKHLGYDEENEFSIKWCGTSTNMHTYSVDGERYHCQYFLPNSIGYIKAKKSNEIKLETKINIDLLDEKCRICKVREACPSCYGANYAIYGDVYHKDKAMCELTKIILKARSFFRALQWENGKISFSKFDEKLLLKSIKLIQDV